MHFRGITVEPYPDLRRLRVTLDFSPFQQSPTIEIQVTDGEGQVIAQTSFIEPNDFHLDFTLHLRQAIPGGQYQLTAVMIYTEPVAQLVTPFFLPSPEQG